MIAEMDADGAVLLDDDDSEHRTPPPPSSSKHTCAMFSCATIVFTVFVASGGFAAGTAYEHVSNGVTSSVAQMVLFSNTSADMCTSPTDFVCGGFADTFYKHGSAIGVFQMRVDAHVQRALDVQYKSLTTRSPASYFYTMCKTEPFDDVEMNQTAVWLWRRGFTAANISIGRTVNPNKQYESLPYIEYGTEDVGPTIIESYQSACAAELVQLVHSVTRLNRVQQVMVYGNYTLLCRNVHSVQDNITVPQVVRNSYRCLQMTKQLWGGYLATLSDDLMPSTQRTQIQHVFKAVQTAYVEHFATRPELTVLRDKIAAITCETSYTAAVESYVVPTGSFADVYYDLLQQQFERRVHASIVDSDWAMQANDINAYYNPYTNKLYVLPAMAMFLHDSSNSVPLLYGRLGYILGHEIGHSIESHGIMFDASGTFVPGSILPDAATREQFDKDRACFVAEFGTNGRTVDEDLADHMGLVIAARVVKTMPVASAVRICAPRCTELNAMAQFYMYFAQTWCSAQDANADTTDVHSPGMTRVSHALKQMHASAVFGCSMGHQESACQMYGL